MIRNFKTSKNNRIDYIYYFADGTKIKITPGEDGVTEANIKELHCMDDEEVDAQRRDEYRVKSHFGEGQTANDYNKYFADNSYNPEYHYIESEDEAKHQEELDYLTVTMECLLPQQKELVKKVYFDQRTNVDIALEEGITEAAIRNRMKKIHKKLRKIFKGGVRKLPIFRL